jgi:hypothetical protein
MTDRNDASMMATKIARSALLKRMDGEGIAALAAQDLPFKVTIFAG